MFSVKLNKAKWIQQGHCFPKSIIIQAVYLKLRFTLSYRDVEEIMRIRGVEVDHATTQRWVYKFMPEIEIQMCKRKKVKDNNGTPELINIDKSGSNKSAIKLYNKRSFTNIQQGLGFAEYSRAKYVQIVLFFSCIERSLIKYFSEWLNRCDRTQK